MSFHLRVKNLLASEVAPYFRASGKKPLLRQMRECRDLRRRYGCLPYHYFKHRLYLHDGREVGLYFPPDVVGRFQRAANPPEHMMMLEKHETARHLAARGLAVVQDLLIIKHDRIYDGDDQPVSPSAALAMLAAHEMVFVKPLIGGTGDNARVISPAFLDLEALHALDGYVVQPVVQNHPVLAAFHAASLNTVRFDTLATSTDVIINGAALKFGTGGCSVDNWAKGGIAIGVDLATGRLNPWGVTKQKGSKAQRTVYHQHPDSGLPFDGVIMPYWEQAKELAKTAADALRPHVTLGWDIAFTPDGPIAIEANETGDFFLLQEACGGLAETALCVEALGHARGRGAPTVPSTELRPATHPHG
jgi:hypothetical protein